MNELDLIMFCLAVFKLNSFMTRIGSLLHGHGHTYIDRQM